MDLHEADDEARQRLADQDLDRPQGRHQQLIEGALLALARHRQGGDQHGDHQGEEADDAGDEEPAALQIGVEPGAGLQLRRQAAAGLGGRSSRLLKRSTMSATYVGDLRGVGVAPVDEHSAPAPDSPPLRRAVKRGPICSTSITSRAVDRGRRSRHWSDPLDQFEARRTAKRASSSRAA